jgi:uncharacterized protein (TIGR04255 family)
MKSDFSKPLGGPSPAELPLSRAPLERVIAQVKFPLILKIEDRAAASTFQEAIRGDYPVLRQQQGHTVQIQLGPTGPVAMPSSNNIWQFADANDAWKLTLSRDSLTIETSAYQSRADFLARWTKVMAAMEGIFQPALAERVGMRYIDRIVGAHFERFDSFIQKDFLGSALATLKSQLKHSLNEATFNVEEGELLLRWGVMSAGMTPDPTSILILDKESFLLDIDVSSPTRRQFNSGDLSLTFQRLAERAYTVFRFAVTDEFLKAYGAVT